MHGRVYFTDSCKRNNVLPLNYLILGDTTFHSDLTHHKGDKRSQIDYVITDSVGRK